MTAYGQYEASPDPLFRGIQTTVTPARPVGETGEYRFALKIFESDPGETDESQARAEVVRFLDRVRPLKQLTENKAKYWTPIHDSGVSGSGAFYVTDLYPRKVEDLVISQVKLDGPSMHRVCEAVCQGLRELRSVCGRAHGALKASNVMISDTLVMRARILLSDPAPASQLATELEDLRALGRMIYRLVFFQEFREIGGWPIAEAPQWERFGKNADAWRGLCNTLLNPSLKSGSLTVAAVMNELKGLAGGPSSSSGGGSGKIIIGGVAAALLLAGGAGLYFSGLLGGSGGPTTPNGPTGNGPTGGNGNGTGVTPVPQQRVFTSDDYDAELLREWVLQSVFLKSLLDATDNVPIASDPFGSIRIAASGRLFPDLGRLDDDRGEVWSSIEHTPTYRRDVDLIRASHEFPEWYSLSVVPLLDPTDWAGGRELEQAIDALRGIALTRSAGALQAWRLSQVESLTDPDDARRSAGELARVLSQRIAAKDKLSKMSLAANVVSEAREALDAFNEQIFALRVRQLLDPVESALLAGELSADRLGEATLLLERRAMLVSEIADTSRSKIGEEMTLEFENHTADLRDRVARARGEDVLRYFEQYLDAVRTFDPAVVIAANGSTDQPPVDTNGTPVATNGEETDPVTPDPDPDDQPPVVVTTDDPVDPDPVDPDPVDPDPDPITITIDDPVEDPVVDEGPSPEELARLEQERQRREAEALAAAAAAELARARQAVREQIEGVPLATAAPGVSHPELEAIYLDQQRMLIERLDNEGDHDRVRANWRRLNGYLLALQSEIEEITESAPDIAREAFDTRLDAVLGAMSRTAFAGGVPDRKPDLDEIRAEAEWLDRRHRALVAAADLIRARVVGDEVIAAMREAQRVGSEPFAANYTGVFEDAPLVERVRTIFETSDRSALLDRVRDDSRSTLERWYAWRRVTQTSFGSGANTGDLLRQELDALASLSPLLDGASGAEATGFAVERWATALAAAPNPGAFEQTLALGRERLDSGGSLDRAMVDRVRANIELVDLRETFRAFRDAGPETPEQTALRERVAMLEQNAAFTPEQRAWLAKVSEAANAEGGGSDLGQAGPGTKGWRLISFNDNVATYRSPDGRRDLRFRLADQRGSTGVFLGEQEVSVGLYLSLGQDLSWVGTRQPSNEQLRVWLYEGGRARIAPYWFGVDNAGRSQELIYPSDEFQRDHAPVPTEDMPMQNIPGDKARLAAEALGCRLPTAAEWRAALREEIAAGGATPTWNLRDRTWARYAGYVRDYDRNRARLRFSTSEFFQPLWGVRGTYFGAPTNERSFSDRYREQLPAAPASEDGAVWFEPVQGPIEVSASQSRGSRFIHLIGNVAEFVSDGGTIGVIGGSALSDPALIGQSGDPASWPVGPAEDFGMFTRHVDVGFRLAFEASVGRDVLAELDVLMGAMPMILATGPGGR